MQMQVNVKERHCHLNQQSREQIERRIRSAFDRFSALLSKLAEIRSSTP